MSATAVRPLLALLPGGKGATADELSQPRPTLEPRLTVRQVIWAHEIRGGWWELTTDANGDVLIGAAFDDGWANSFGIEILSDLDADGCCLAHDIGLPPQLWSVAR